MRCFGGVGFMTGISWLDSGDDPDHGVDTGISLKEFLSLLDSRQLSEFCWQLKKLSTNSSKFLIKIKYKTTSNLLYHAVQKVASDEHAELQKLMQ